MSIENFEQKFKGVIDNTPSKWKEKAEYRQKNRVWLDRSAKIAFKVLQTLRAKKMTQKDLAVALKVTPQQISKIVKGQENLTLETISRIEVALGIELITVTSFSSYSEVEIQNPTYIKENNYKAADTQKFSLDDYYFDETYTYNYAHESKYKRAA